MLCYCKLCGDEITEENRSSEHIIPNAIGGILEDKNIYCKKCNSSYGSNLDKMFSDIFIPFVEGLDIHKSRKSKGSIYKGIMYDIAGNLYNVDFKAGKIRTIKDKDNKYVGQKPNPDMTLLGYKFELNNNAFKSGMAKMAFNFAVHNSIEPAAMERIFDVKSKKLLEKPVIIPFFPLTLFDAVMEAKEPDRLFHALRLFNNGKRLYVYIELFSTFQFYVLVSEVYEGGVDKDIDVCYCNYIEKNAESQDAKLSKRSYEHPYKDVVDAIYGGLEFHKIFQDFFDSKVAGAVETADRFYEDFAFYTVYDEDCVNLSKYKRILPNGSGYPETLAQVIRDRNSVREYTFGKFNMLSDRTKN